MYESPQGLPRSPRQRLKDKYLSLSRWAQIATIIGPIVAIVAAVLPIYLTGGHSNVIPSTSLSPVASTAPLNSTAAPTSTTAATTQSGVPAADLGSWGGELEQVNGAISRVILNLNNSGSPGSPTPVGTFNNQTANCQGDVLLNGVTTGNLVDLNLETTQNPGGTCVSSAEVDVQLAANGVNLDLWMIGAGNEQGSLTSPLAEAVLSH